MAEISQRKRIWGWYFFDWASQPYHTLAVTFVFGPYFVAVAAQHYMNAGLDELAADANAQALWSTALAISGLIIAFGAPIIGAIADTSGRRIPWIFGFSILYFIGAFGLWWTMPDGSNMVFSLCLFSVGFIGAEYALIFVNSQLPSLGPPESAGETSGSGFAFGYLGGLLSLILMLVFFQTLDNGRTIAGLAPLFGLDPALEEDKRIVGPFIAIWFAIFMVPYFRWVREPRENTGTGSVSAAFATLIKALKNLPARKSLLNYLVSSMFYRDALNGLYAFGGTYAALVLDWSIVQIGIFGIISVIAAGAFSWLGGKLDLHYGPKPVIIFAIFGLLLVCITVVSMDRMQIFGFALADGSSTPDAVFFGCGVLIGGFGGTLQAASRTLMVRHTDPVVPTESFALYGLSGRATAFIAPALIGFVTTWTGNARLGVSPLIILFAIGLFLLLYVKAEGDKETWSGSRAAVL
ncbi:MAG: MFS transporter [Pseudomonadota bacterium]